MAPVEHGNARTHAATRWRRAIVARALLRLAQARWAGPGGRAPAPRCRAWRRRRRDLLRGASSSTSSSGTAMASISRRARRATWTARTSSTLSSASRLLVVLEREQRGEPPNVHLGLSNNSNGNEGAQFFGAALERLLYLTSVRLELYDNGVGKEGAQFLGAALGKLLLPHERAP
eukprot:11178649-Lingulodinium_polyedra.AAC.1